MFSATGLRLPLHAFVMAGLLPMVSPLLAEDAEGGYRLLELDGYTVKWGEQKLGSGAQISCAFADATLSFDDARNCGDLASIKTVASDNLPVATIAREAQAAFRVWERVAGVSFHLVSDAGNADIVIGAQGEPRGSAYANVSYASGPAGDVRSIDQGLVCLNPEQEWKVGFDGDTETYDLRYTLIHEIGHAIGLDHPGPSGQVMAFRYTEEFSELQPGDVRGIRRLYGRTAEALTVGASGNDARR